MAAGYLSQLSGGQIEVRSAGSEPADKINPIAVEAMAEEGIEHCRRTTQDPDHGGRQSFRRRDHHGVRDTCPYYPGKRYEDWVLDDPAGQDLNHVRPIRDQIRRRVESLIDQLLPS